LELDEAVVADLSTSQAKELIEQLAQMGQAQPMMPVLVFSGGEPLLHEKPFSVIWADPDEPLLKGLRNRRAYIKGRCRLYKYFDACGCSLRVRADLHFGDPWAPEPACYLTDEEIGLNTEKQAELTRTGEIFQLPKTD